MTAAPSGAGVIPCQPKFSVAGKGKGQGFGDPRHLWRHLVRDSSASADLQLSLESKLLERLDTAGSTLFNLTWRAQDYSVGKAVLGACKRRCAAPETAAVLRGRQQQQGIGKVHRGDRYKGLRLDLPAAVKLASWPTPTKMPYPVRLTDSGEVLTGCSCRDGKFRPVEPSTSPLAHGSAKRVGRLRGYGNAIVAPVATGFVQSYMELER